MQRIIFSKVHTYVTFSVFSSTNQACLFRFTERRNVLLHCDFIEKQMAVNFMFIKQLKDDLCERFTAVNYFNNCTVAEKYQSNAAIHSTGIVHILLHYCHSWADIVLKSNESNLANYESCIYIVVLSPVLKKKQNGTIVTSNGTSTDGHSPASCPALDENAYPQLIQWAKRRVPAIKNFYLILDHSEVRNDLIRFHRITNEHFHLK